MSKMRLCLGELLTAQVTFTMQRWLKVKYGNFQRIDNKELEFMQMNCVLERSGKWPQSKAALDLFPEHGTETCRKEIQCRTREAECWVCGGKPEKGNPADSNESCTEEVCT